jgi:hypothetical protein
MLARHPAVLRPAEWRPACRRTPAKRGIGDCPSRGRKGYRPGALAPAQTSPSPGASRRILLTAPCDPGSGRPVSRRRRLARGQPPLPPPTRRRTGARGRFRTLPPRIPAPQQRLPVTRTHQPRRGTAAASPACGGRRREPPLPIGAVPTAASNGMTVPERSRRPPPRGQGARVTAGNGPGALPLQPPATETRQPRRAFGETGVQALVAQRDPPRRRRHLPRGSSVAGTESSPALPCRSRPARDWGAAQRLRPAAYGWSQAAGKAIPVSSCGAREYGPAMTGTPGRPVLP